MAQRKLSPRQRAALRKDLQKGLSKGTEPSEVLNQVAKKYSIRPESARWYLNTLKGGKKKAKAKRKSKKAARKGGRKSAPKGRSGRLLDVVRTFSRESLRRAIAAKDLFSRLQAQLKKKQLLERAEKQVKKKVKAVTSSVRKIEKKLRNLTVR